MKKGPKTEAKSIPAIMKNPYFFATMSFMCRFSPRPSILGAIWLTFGLPLATLWVTFGSRWLTFGSLLAPFGSLLAHFWCPLAHFWCPFLHFCSPRAQFSHFCCILSSFFVSFWIFHEKSKLPEAKVPLRALEGWVRREDLLSVGMRSMRFGKIRLEQPRRWFSKFIRSIVRIYPLPLPLPFLVGMSLSDRRT